MKINKICVIGLGYIGLPTAALFASKHIEVLGVDIDESIVTSINQGTTHIIEPDLDALVKKLVSQNYLKASLKPQVADVFIICVPTPFKDEQDYEPELSYIQKAAQSIAAFLKKGDLIILESTSPVGTTLKLSQWLSKHRKDLLFPHQAQKADIFVSYCPERVLPGQILKELKQNDRIIGGLNEKSSQKAKQVYELFVKGTCLSTNAQTAELVKLVENSFRDVNIAFANELSLLCDKLDINVYELIYLANKHPRVNILNPACGVGGHCIAVDPYFIIYNHKKEARLIKTAREVNNNKMIFVLEKIIQKVNSSKTKSIACLGLSFKADIDDLRESPALKIALKLCELGFEVLACEPNIKNLPQALQNTKNLTLVSLNEALKCENIAVLVAHKAFLELEFDLEKVLDFCGITHLKVKNAR